VPGGSRKNCILGRMKDQKRLGSIRDLLRGSEIWIWPEAAEGGRGVGGGE